MIYSIDITSINVLSVKDIRLRMSIPPKADTKANAQTPYIMPPAKRDIETLSLFKYQIHIFSGIIEWVLLPSQPSRTPMSIELVLHMSTPPSSMPLGYNLALCPGA